MCSVVGCDSFRRNAKRFKLPDDPEERLEWVQFVLEVNGQRLKESSWTDITICSEHFTTDCFVDQSLQLRSGSVPSLCVKSEPEEAQENLQRVDSVENTDAPDDLETSDSKPFCPENTDSISPGSGQIQQKVLNKDLNKERAALLQMKGKYLVNESCLLELFVRKCPSCGSKLQMEKVTYGLLIILNQRCFKCDYRNQWKSQINADVPTAEDRNLAGGSEVKSEEVSTDEDPSSAFLSEIITFSDDESDPLDDGEEDDDDEESSDGEWNPTEDFALEEELMKDSEDETEDEGEDENFDSVSGLKMNELCAECGSFFNILKPHTCEHKIKPYSCNICGKRCVTEIALNSHSRIHDENYEHRCKYCHVTFKTKVDKVTHEQTHLTEGKPYKCPDCSETFATNKERRIHLVEHRGPRQLKCHICGIEFNRRTPLRRHLAVHTGAKPYKCSVCQRGFNQSSHLKSHMRLHTGERPYKCQHCDKCFNHNVSLKSHIQRYHTSSSGRGQKKCKKNKTVSDTDDAQESGNKRGTDYGVDIIEEEQDQEEEVQKNRIHKPKKRSTGRPIGRPKRNTADNLFQGGEMQSSSTKIVKVKARKRTHCSDEDSEEELMESDITFDSTEDEEEWSKKVTTQKSKGRLKNSDGDSGKRRGRPRKNQAVEDS
ncbi:zinc finger protein with KRAB and SCAN domains 7-like [Amphiprion ocellaris]|uniref:zinc finger protein with KRAB and SCAN domains 7-like n=1 Tax=Amphiprion ocellaris TaxID=80972 RepID=UPI000C31243A|nr:zinc finger protein with KRAB and SCAN domains 7-like [Amphiprion ocellaris]